MYLQPVILWLAENWKESECAVGVRALSKEWGERYRWVTWGGLARDTIYAADQSKWDKRIFPLLAECAARVFAYVAREKLRYGPADVRKVYKLVLGAVYRYVILHGDVFFLYRGSPSGVFGTAEVNSVMMSIVMRVMCGLLLGRFDLEEVAHAMHFGDDDFSGVHPDYATVFNQLTVAEKMVKFGFTITSATKGDVALPFTPPEEVTFLKRFFRVEGDRVYAPLTKLSIWAMLGWETPTGNITAEQRFVQVSNNALREAFLWGREFYDEVRAVVETIACAYVVVIVPESYEAIQKLYDEGVLETWDA
jgi:hypothetical protein